MPMPLQAFSETLGDLYSAAEHTTPDIFPDKILQLIGKLIDFDGAMMGSTVIDSIPHARLAINQFHIFNREKTLLRNYAKLSEEDPVAGALLAGLRNPLIVDCEKFYAEKGLVQLSAFMRKYAVSKLLLHGQTPSPGRSGHFLALFRSNRKDFDDFDAQTFQALWHHFLQSWAINLSRALHDVDPHGRTRAHALVNQRGRIIAANEAIIGLLKLEWAYSDGQSLPAPVHASLNSTLHYRGKSIEIFATQKHGYLACTARRAPLVERLSPSERNVAESYAKGMTHTEIAFQFKVSHHTVRNQLANIYLKLGVHSKTELIRSLSSRQKS